MIVSIGSVPGIVLGPVIARNELIEGWTSWGTKQERLGRESREICKRNNAKAQP